MNDALLQKQKNRFILLHKLYELTDGVAERHSIDIREIGVQLGMTSDLALNTFEYLKGEGLAKWMALGGYGTITHWGIKEVEDALVQRPTAHFPANIIILTNSPGATINAGVNNNTSTIFDQRNQQVKYQYNAAGNINLNSSTTKDDFIKQLDLLKTELKVAADAQAIDELLESKIRTLILEAIAEARKASPEKTSLVNYLKQANDSISSITSVAELAGSITNAYEWAKQFL
ncbi:hypothetical protein [Duganella sp. FT27W]|uniref:hypothetical protein n=1 Tax=Duganella sp. FT27W TaxID=2654636 RepID=UPI00128AED25|nr:hypothetical protein [Duganella sp. FT27W]MPQ57197.1 hypothetical protein [Duganella sp. FT27W]